MARVHRLGQTKTVHVYRLISAGTIEERNVERAQKKLYLDQVVNRDSARATENKALTAFSTDEMLQSLQFGSNAVFGDSNSDLNCLPSEEDIRHITDRSRSEDDSMGNVKGGASHTLGDFDASAKLTSSSKLGGIDFQAIREAHWKSGGRKQSEKTLIAGAQALAKRQVKSRIIVVKDDDGRDIPVLKSNNYDLENGESSVFDRELSGREQDGFVEKKRAKALRSGVDFGTSDLCQVCGDGDSTAPLSFCTKCPVAYHQDCFVDFCNQHGCSQWGERCSHHNCIKCNRCTSNAGGILFPCQSCPNAFCEDCLQSETVIAGHVGTAPDGKTSVSPPSMPLTSIVPSSVSNSLGTSSDGGQTVQRSSHCPQQLMCPMPSARKSPKKSQSLSALSSLNKPSRSALSLMCKQEVARGREEEAE